jgi:hypothetical protein
VKAVVPNVVFYLVSSWAANYVWGVLSDPVVHAGLVLLVACTYAWLMFQRGVFGWSPHDEEDARTKLTEYVILGACVGIAGGFLRMGVGVGSPRSMVTSVIISDVGFSLLFLFVVLPTSLRYVASQWATLFCAGLIILLFDFFVFHHVAVASVVDFGAAFVLLLLAIFAAVMFWLSLSRVFRVEEVGSMALGEIDDRFSLFRTDNVKYGVYIARRSDDNSLWTICRRRRLVSFRYMVWAATSVVLLYYVFQLLVFDPCSADMYDRANVAGFFLKDSTEKSIITVHGWWCGWEPIVNKVIPTAPVDESFYEDPLPEWWPRWW